MNFEIIATINNINFYRRTIRDINTIFCRKNNIFYINYSKILINLNRGNNNRNGLRNIIISDQFLEDFNIYCRNNNIDCNKEVNFESINDLVNNSNNIFFNINSGVREIYGTYGPIDFIDVILVGLNSEYRQEVHRLMTTIQNLADSTNNTFRETLQNTINELQRRVEELTTENNNLKNKNKTYENQIKYTNIVSKLKNQFHYKDLETLRDEMNKQHQHKL